MTTITAGTSRMASGILSGQGERPNGTNFCHEKRPIRYAKNWAAVERPKAAAMGARVRQKKDAHR